MNEANVMTKVIATKLNQLPPPPGALVSRNTYVRVPVTTALTADVTAPCTHHSRARDMSPLAALLILSITFMSGSINSPIPKLMRLERADCSAWMKEPVDIQVQTNWIAIAMTLQIPPMAFKMAQTTDTIVPITDPKKVARTLS